MTVELYLLNRIEQLETRLKRTCPFDPAFEQIAASIMELKKVLDFIQN